MKTRNNTIFILTGIMITAALVWYYFYSSTFVALAVNDSMDYASIARNVSRGQGFISSYITPLGLASKEGLPHPDLWRAPAWPVAIALFIKMFGAIDQAAALASGFFYLAALPLIFFIARYWFGNAVAVGTSLIYIFSAQNLYFSISGLTEPIALFMMAAVVYLLYLPQFKNPVGDILLGVVAGAFYLTRYNALLFIPLIAACRVHLRGPERIRSVLLFCISFVLTVLPWMWRNFSLMGSPLFSLQKYEPVMFTETYPGYTLYTMMKKVDVAEFINTHCAEMWSKIVENWYDFTAHLFDPLFTGISPVLFGLFLLALFLPFNEKQRGFRPFLLAAFGLQLAALMVIHYIPRLFFMFMPFYIMYGLAALESIVSRSGKKVAVTLAGIGVFAMVFVFTNLPDWKQPNVREPLVREFSVSINKAINLTNKQELILSNDGHLLAWYGDRYAAKLPYSTDMLPQILKLAPVKMIYLSGRMSWNMPEADDSWRKVFWGRPQQLYDFRLVGKFEDGSLLYERNKN